MNQNDLDSIERLLADWADWMRRGGSTTDGYPRKSTMATDSRIHSIEDMEIEVDQSVMLIVNTAVYDLVSPQRFCVLRRHGLMKQVWRLANELAVYDSAIENLREVLKKKIVV